MRTQPHWFRVGIDHDMPERQQTHSALCCDNPSAIATRRVRKPLGGTSSGTTIAPAMAQQRHQVGDQQKCHRVRRDDCGAATRRLGGHVDQRARVLMTRIGPSAAMNTDFIASVSQ
jgi:hypothetical protein